MTDQPATGAPASADTPSSSEPDNIHVTGTEPEVVTPTAEETAAATAAAETKAADEAKAAEDAKAAERAPEQLQKAFNKIAFEKREAERRTRELEEQLAEYRKQKEAAPKAADGKAEPETMTRAEAQAWAQEEAKKLSAAQQAETDARQKADAFNKAANTVYETGVKEFPDFEATVSNLRNMGHMNFDTVDTALATDNPQRVLYELGKNLDEAERIMALSPAKRAVEFAKLAAKAPPAPTKKEVSAAPPPVQPLEGGARISDELRDEDSDLEWGKKFEKRMAARQR